MSDSATALERSCGRAGRLRESERQMRQAIHKVQALQKDRLRRHLTLRYAAERSRALRGPWQPGRVQSDSMPAQHPKQTSFGLCRVLLSLRGNYRFTIEPLPYRSRILQLRSASILLRRVSHDETNHASRQHDLKVIAVLELGDDERKHQPDAEAKHDSECQ